MLPQTTADSLPTSSNRTIYINPNFKGIAQFQANKKHTETIETSRTSSVSTTQSQNKLLPPVAHINPLFLLKSRHASAPAPPTTMHINPNFLLKQQQQLLMQQQQHQMHVQQQELLQQELSYAAAKELPSSYVLPKSVECKIISKTRTKLIREPTVINIASKPPQFKPVVKPCAPIVSLSKRKLIRASASVLPKQPISIFKLNNSKIAMIAPSKSSVEGKYKLDNRKKLLPNGTLDSRVISSQGIFAKRKRKTSFVARFALQRNNSNTIVAKSKINTRHQSLMGSTISSTHRKLQLLNINGVLYKSTKNKLQRKDLNPNTASVMPLNKSNALTSTSPHAASHSSAAPSNGRTLFVRGTKFVMDSNGFKLIRVPANNLSSNSAMPRSLSIQRRIDIGGRTYVASSKSQNVYVRTGNHLALAHLNTAKQRSLQMLSRKLVKSNMPCAIYQRLGKCAALERGKCNKVHNKLHVIICPKFLRGDCHNDKCLLSHQVSLSKMPVCRYFLLGICTRTDCPYLHKKLSSKTEICEEFLKGYCQLAAQCNKRHEFLCPSFERSGKCTSTNCIYCKTVKKRAEQQQKTLNKLKAKSSSRHENAEEHQILNRDEPPSQQMESSASETPAKRYFNGAAERLGSISKAPLDTNEKTEANQSLDDIEEDDDEQQLVQRPRRPKLGILPAFIPL